MIGASLFDLYRFMMQRKLISTIGTLLASVRIVAGTALMKATNGKGGAVVEEAAGGTVEAEVDE